RNKLRVVRGDTVLQAGDEVMIFSEHPRGSQLRERLSGDTSGEDDFAETTSVKHREVIIPSGKGASGMLVKDLNLPENCVLVRILRGEKVILPRGNTRLQGEDRVEIVGHEEQLLQAEICLAS
ncbi:MAG: TrkA C-terminal domain-containing protein, partial [SAR324 cluster bacterium]|nr:TrkA C-terminal domain-containing protein [SAR324 cluster bacterium]